ncbi:protein STRUBBELIG-RECEPTOR FAMILY 2 [Cornus florida]|uniref:protein STRUBBELIG-RECEPTOR FAMILY 2 n=1 Tax=Cornus florida TaxID=4283 RepID=UPI00289EA598|nr:protein STRUBBELIG-RECEPTOR FAMILY 2 [Cornus florida]
MATWCIWLYLTVIVFSAILVSQASAYTNPLDVKALQGLYIALNGPPQLKEWKSVGGDPCEESWIGVSCFESSVIQIKLNGLELNGTLGFQLSDLHNLKQLDVSSNNIQGEIPYSLPLNATHINLACNNFSLYIPYSLTLMKNLRHLNLSHNSLSGPVGNVFTGLQNLREMDLSYNNFTGDLPSSFGDLTNLTGLFLQNNKFTGSVAFLAGLPLSNLNIQDNNFSGVIPSQLRYVKNLWIGGNRFQVGENYPAWDFPLETMPSERNISSPPTTKSSAIENYPPRRVAGHKKKRLGPGGIAFMVGGGTLVATCAALIILIRIQRSRTQKLPSVEIGEGSQNSPPLSTARVENFYQHYSSAAPEESPQIFPISSPPVALVASSLIPSVCPRTEKLSRRRSFSKKHIISLSAKFYTVAELQSATNSFSEENLLGEGSLGSVYKAEFPDGQILAVKNIKTAALSLNEEEQFLDVIRRTARLRHPNIVALLGYCVEHGQHLLVYEYIRNLSLEYALHCDAYMPLSWGLRIRIALGIARALSYLHSTCFPAIAHCNLKAANILLDEELMPRICDCGLAILRPLTSNSVKVKASEMALGDTVYIAPEHVHHGDNSTKCDVYAYGVLLLELLTGRRPFDSSRPREEQSLVKWASSRLHDNESLDEMVDPTIKRTLSSKCLSRFADIVSLCIQPEKEFRPPMSEIVEHLTSLLQRVGTGKSNIADTSTSEAADPFDKSFRSTQTRFFGSPTVSFRSA